MRRHAAIRQRYTAALLLRYYKAITLLRYAILYYAIHTYADICHYTHAHCRHYILTPHTLRHAACMSLRCLLHYFRAVFAAAIFRRHALMIVITPHYGIWRGGETAGWQAPPHADAVLIRH